MAERFWENVNMTETCWLWTGTIPQGYGTTYYGRAKIQAHRLSWILCGNDIPEGHIIRHKCRNKNCVNPEHLETGTHAENQADRLRDGTSTRGIKHPQAKLTEEQVRAIRTIYSAGNISQERLAKEYGVSRETISHIVQRRLWSHI